LATLPEIPEKVRVVSPHKYRYFFNYCAFSYTMAFWDWDDLERMIDLMALYGVNAPLSVTGQEGVWQNVGKR
jgi:alpha-N-acetylglucosaminidase